MADVITIASWDDVPRSLTAGAVLLELDGGLPGDPVRGLARLAALEVPVVTALAGAGDATLLAAATISAVALAAPSLTVDCSSRRQVLELGLPWALLQRGAQALLFAAQPLGAARLAAAGLVETRIAGAGGDGVSDASAAARRLAQDPGAALLVRSLRAAARSSAAQAAAYDRELRELL